MKRIVLVCLIVALLLCSCSHSPFTGREREILDLLQPHYEADAVITTGTMQLRVRLSHPTPTQCEATVLAPESVADLRYVFRQDNIDVSFKSLQFSFDPVSMPQTAPIKLTVSALNTLLRIDDEAALRHTGETWELSGAAGGSDCVLVLSEDGLPQKLLCEDAGLEIALENFVFLG